MPGVARGRLRHLDDEPDDYRARLTRAMELIADEHLEGQQGELSIEIGVNGDRIPGGPDQLTPAVPGADDLDAPNLQPRWSPPPAFLRPEDPNDLAFASVGELGELIRTRQVSCRELTELALGVGAVNLDVMALLDEAS